MDNNNWRPIQGGEPVMDTTDWRTQLQPDSRQRIVNKIMDTLKKHLPFSGQEGLHELKKIAERFEEKIYTAATSQSDYLRKISLKMLTMETKSQNTIPNSLPSNPVGTSSRPPDPGSLGMQPQVHNQGQPLAMPLPPNQSQTRQQLLSQNIQNSAAVQSSSSLSSALPPTSSGQNSIPSVVGQNTNMQNMPGNSQNSIASSMGGQGVPANMYANSQRQMQGRQPVVPQQQQQSQNPQQQYLYQQPQQMLKPKFPQGNIPQSMMQSHIQQQQQNLLQPTQLQSSQQAVVQTSPAMQPPMMQSSLPSLQQNQPSVLRQQQQPQQAAVPHQQQAQMSQQQQQQQLIGQRPNSTNMQQSHLIGQQNNVGYLQQQQRLLGQQNNLSNLQQQQQQLMAQQNNLSNLHQQQLGPQSNVSGLQQQQLLGTQTGNSGMQTNQHPVHMLQQPKAPLQQQPQQNGSNMLPTQAQQSQPQQQMLSQLQQAKPQIPAQLPSHQNQMPQLHQINDVNDMKMRQSMGAKPGVFQQHLPAGQRSAYSHPQLKSSFPFPISSNQLLQASSPQILQHSSPRVDQQNLLTSLTKPGTPLQSANSPFVVPSPSTPMAPSPMPGDSEKPVPSVSSLSNAGNVRQQQTSGVVAPAQSLAIGTPGISASPLLAEFSGPDGTHGNTLASVSVFSVMGKRRLLYALVVFGWILVTVTFILGGVFLLHNVFSMENNNWRLIQGGEPTYWRPLPETSSSSIGSTAQNGDWQEEVYQKIKTMKELYLPELFEMYQKIDAKLQQLDSLPQQPKLEQLDKLKLFKNTLERAIQFLQVPKCNIGPMYKEKLAQYEKQIVSFINTNRPRKPVSQLQQGQHPPSMGSVQQSPVSTLQQANISGLSSQNGINMLQPNINTLEANFNMLQLQDQYMKQQQEQHQLGLQQQSYPLQCNIPQRLHVSGQTPGSFFQTENVNDQQEQLYLSQKPLPETSSTYAYSTAQTGHASGDDWQEEVYQKIKAMKEIYLPELLEMYQKIAAKLQQLDSLPQQPKLEQLDKLKFFQSTLGRAIQFLQVPKGNIEPMYKEKLAHYEKQIISFINTNRPRNPVS